MEHEGGAELLMQITKHDISLRTLKLLNVCLITLPFAICWLFFYADHTAAVFARNARIYVLILYALLYIFFGRTYNAFLVSYARVSEMAYSQMLAASISDGFIFIIICFLCKRLEPIWPGLLAILGQSLLAIIWAFLANKWYFHTYPANKTYIVYDIRLGMDNLVRQYGLSRKFKIEKVLQVSYVLDNLSVLDSAEMVFFSGIHSHDRNIIMKYCTEKGIKMMVLPRIGDVIMAGATKMHILHLPIYMVNRYNPKPEFIIIKRVTDIILSSIALIVTSPIFLVVSILIKKDGGPAFYLQDRLTKDGKVFTIIKFRSMRIDAEKDGIARLSTGENDDRITPVGHVIRKLRIDELPQLINILKGDMSIVGPRPERPEIAALYEKSMPEFRLRLQCKAGLTGYAQVFGKYNTTPYDKLLMDLMYISDPGVVQDFRIILSTIKILFLPESTEGVAVGATTAMDYENAADSTENDAETVTK